MSWGAGMRPSGVSEFDGLGQLVGQAGQQLLATEAGTLGEEFDLLGRQHLGDVGGSDRLVLAGADP